MITICNEKLLNGGVVALPNHMGPFTFTCVQGLKNTNTLLEQCYKTGP